MGELETRLNRFGAAQVRAALGDSALGELWASIRPETSAGAVRAHSQEVYGARGILTARAELEHWLAGSGVTNLAANVLGVAVFPIEARFFDKRADANWAVPAHQDLIVPVPVAAPADAVRYRRQRHGMTYGEPASAVLQELVALRIHLDDAGAASGGLAIVDGSHARGRLSDAELRKIPLEAFTPYDCCAGDVLLMKPLAIHRSGRSTLPARRRVLHVLYAPRDGWHGRLARQAA